MNKIPTAVGPKHYLVLSRKKFTDQSIIGKVSFRLLAGKDKVKPPEYSTLELAWKGNKRCISCIPPGIYPLKYKQYGRFYTRYNEKFGHDFVVLVGSVPGRSEILFHIGNAPPHTKGCVLVGRPSRTANFVGSSVETYKKFYREIAKRRPQYLIVEQNS